MFAVCARLAFLSRSIMEVILREHVDNLGRRGEVVKVADGYARNYLLPRKLALLATEGNKKQIERERARFEAKEAEEKKSAGAIADRMANVEIEIARKVGETEALYGSVTSTDIAEALAARGIEVDRRKVQLPEPIKKLGEYDIPVRLHRELTTHVKVRVVAEGAPEKGAAEKK
jgi:large subunit ribosomal protein L9